MKVEVFEDGELVYECESSDESLLYNNIALFINQWEGGNLDLETKGIDNEEIVDLLEYRVSLTNREF